MLTISEKSGSTYLCTLNRLRRIKGIAPLDGPQTDPEGAGTAAVMTADVKAFAEALEEKLKIRRQYGYWAGIPMIFYLDRLHDELAELVDAFFAFDDDLIGSYENIMDECVDVANFAMMLFTNAAKAKQEGEDADRKAAIRKHA